MSIEENLDKKAEEMEAAEAAKGNGVGAGEVDLVEASLEELAARARIALSGEKLPDTEFERSMVLAQFAMAADIHYLVEELTDAIEGVKATVASINPMAKMAGMAAAAQAGAPPSVEGMSPLEGFPVTDEPAAPGGAPSWVGKVLADDQNQMNVGKKQVVLEITPGDRQPIDSEHRALLARMQAEGWTLEELNAELKKCKRPAEARMVEVG
jgi:hypothetical protein